jgi:hypothetical protein
MLRASVVEAKHYFGELCSTRNEKHISLYGERSWSKQTLLLARHSIQCAPQEPINPQKRVVLKQPCERDAEQASYMVLEALMEGGLMCGNMWMY